MSNFYTLTSTGWNATFPVTVTNPGFPAIYRVTAIDHEQGIVTMERLGEPADDKYRYAKIRKDYRQTYKLNEFYKLDMDDGMVFVRSLIVESEVPEQLKTRHNELGEIAP